MPLSTRGFLSIGDVQTLSDGWQRTQLGQLVQDESMRPFVDDIKRQLQQKYTGIRKKLGLELGDITEIAGGEIGLGLAERADSSAVVVLTVDISDHRDKADSLLRQIDSDLIKLGSKKSQSDILGTQLTTYNIPPQKKGDKDRNAVFFIKENMLCASDSRAEAEEMLQRFSGQAGNRLFDAIPYQQTMRRCAQEAGSLKPEIRWFLDPFGYARSLRSLKQSPGNPYGKDYLKILTQQGFDAIQGLGGFMNVSVNGSFDLLHRTSIYAPTLPGVADKYRLAMRMLDFPNSSKLSPQAWLPRQLATYRTFHFNFDNAFEHIDTLFDAVAGYENTWVDMMEGVEKDPYGPEVNIRKDLIAHLGNRVTIITDYKLPITTKSERYLLMIETLNPQAITKTVEKFMAADPNANRRVFENNIIWEIIEADEDVLELDVNIPSLEPFDLSEDELSAEEEKMTAPTSAICVAHGHVLIASHIDFMKTILSAKTPRNMLASSGDYLEVETALRQLMSGPASVCSFQRTDEAYRPTYELLRQGKMPQSETIFGWVLNRMLTASEDVDEGILRKQRIDGRQLPGFEMVRRYFGPAGLLVRSEEDGWMLVGAALSKQTLPQARAEAVPSADHHTVR
jgi:hypothetical protein